MKTLRVAQRKTKKKYRFIDNQNDPYKKHLIEKFEESKEKEKLQKNREEMQSTMMAFVGDAVPTKIKKDDTAQEAVMADIRKEYLSK